MQRGVDALNAFSGRLSDIKRARQTLLKKLPLNVRRLIQSRGYGEQMTMTEINRLQVMYSATEMMKEGYPIPEDGADYSSPSDTSREAYATPPLSDGDYAGRAPSSCSVSTQYTHTGDMQPYIGAQRLPSPLPKSTTWIDVDENYGDRAPVVCTRNQPVEMLRPYSAPAEELTNTTRQTQCRDCCTLS
jgi:hypothetical protein